MYYVGVVKRAPLGWEKGKRVFVWINDLEVREEGGGGGGGRCAGTSGGSSTTVGLERRWERGACLGSNEIDG